MMKMLCVYSMKPDGAWREAASWSKMGARKGFGLLHDKSAVKKITPNGNRTRAACLEGKHDNHFTIGVVLERHNIPYNEDTCLSETTVRLSRLVNPSPSCPFKRLAKARYGSQRIIQKAIQTYRLRFARPPPTIHGVPLAHR